MPSLDQQNVRRHPLHAPRVFQRFNLVRGAATWTKIKLAIFQL